MAITKTEIIASAIIVISLVILLIIDSITPLIYHDDNTDYIYPTITSVAALICLAICCLHFRRAPSLTWKMLIVGVFLGSAGALLSLLFLLRPPDWKFGFSLIFSIDTVGIVVFFPLIFIRNKKITVLLALFVSSLVVLYINLRNLGKVEQIEIEIYIVCLLSLVIYLVLLVYVKQYLFKQWWKIAVITVISASVIIVVALLPGIELLSFLVTIIDACSTLLLGLWMYAQNAWHQQMLRDDQHNFLEMAGLPKRFTIKELETATRNFQTPIGEGGSGAVFKGTLEDGSIVAVKRIKGHASGEAEFRTEITIIASLQHINLARLLGYCLTTQGDRYLIYPFFENGSLDAWIFKGEEKRAHLTWMYRYRIASDVAKALAYFHHECHHRILHLDIKPANILLDSSFRALVSDFGISKLIGKDESRVMTRARGTIGYLPPEMLVPNAISTKSDVYSYGMVLFELVGGRKNFTKAVDSERQQMRTSYFPKIVREKMMEGKLMEVVDPCLEHEEIREQEVMVLLRVALWCIQQNPEVRPSTTEIVDMLEGRTPVPMPPESPMFVVDFLNTETQSNNSNQAQDMEVATLSAGTISISIQSGR